MKIGMLVYNLDVSGGYQKLVIRLSQSLTKLGNEVTVYTLSVDYNKCYPDSIKELRIITPATSSNASQIDRFAALASLIPNSLDALVVHDSYSLACLTYLPVAAKYKIAWMLNNQLDHDIKFFWRPVWHCFITTTGTRHRVLTTIHEAHSIIVRHRGLSRVDAFVTYDMFNKSLVKKILHHDATVVFAGADLDEFRQMAKSRSVKQGGVFKILSVGVIFPHRRYEDLIKAVAELKKRGRKVQVTIVGLQTINPDYYEELVSEVSLADVAQEVTFKSFVTDAEMQKLYQSSDAFAFINDGFTWGISVFEAIAARLPVIITNNIGAADLVHNTEEGWVVRPRSAQEIADAIEDIMDHPDVAIKISRQASDRIEPIVSWDAYAHRMLEVISKGA